MAAESLYSFSVRDLSGQSIKMDAFQGKVLLIVNVASQCGFTPQYDGLEKLQKKYGDRGFAVLGFPCNQFGGQEPGSEKEIQTFCETSFGITFPMFAKIDVNGPGADPLFQFLKSKSKGLLGTAGIKWNFTKFLISKDGQKIKRFAPQATPESISPDIEELLS